MIVGPPASGCRRNTDRPRDPHPRRATGLRDRARVADPPGRQAPDDLLVGRDQVRDDQRRRIQHRVERRGLRRRPRESRRGCSRGACPAAASRSRTRSVISSSPTRPPAAMVSATCRPSGVPRLDGRAQRVSRGNVRNRVALGDPHRLGAFPGARRAHQHHDHRRQFTSSATAASMLPAAGIGCGLGVASVRPERPADRLEIHLLHAAQVPRLRRRGANDP